MFGESSGGNLAQEAAPCGLTITRLAVWEPNFRVDGSRALLPDECVRQLTEFEQGGWTDPLMGEHGRYLSDRQRKSPPSMNRFKEAR